MAGAVGALLVLALLVAFYAHEARTEIPRKGEDAERAWSDALRQAAASLASASAGAASSATVDVPPPPPAPSLDVPLLGSAWGAPATGMISLDPACGGFRASHASRGVPVVDLVSVPAACLRLRLDPAYGEGVRYDVEWGGVVRAQRGGAVVLAGAPLDVSHAPDGTLRVSLAVSSLQGVPGTVGIDARGAHVDVSPVGAAPEAPSSPNAGNLTWDVTTRHPAAWRAWLETRLADAGVSTSGPAAQATLACDVPGCVPAASGFGRVRLVVEGPGTAGDDIALAVSHRVVGVTLR